LIPATGHKTPAWARLANALWIGKVPFNQLYHAGEDWFARDSRGRADGHGAAGAPVHAVANGLVTWTQDIGSDGHIVVIAHWLRDGSRVWSAYWHVTRPAIIIGQAVRRGDRIADVLDRGYNSHLHWEIRTFGDGTSLFPPDSAGGRGTCNGRVPALGYTWDDDPARAHPDFWGYRDPTAFVEARRSRLTFPTHLVACAATFTPNTWILCLF